MSKWDVAGPFKSTETYSRFCCFSATGVQKFEQVVFNAVKDKVREGILELIEKERRGEGVDRELLKSVVNVR